MSKKLKIVHICTHFYKRVWFLFFIILFYSSIHWITVTTTDVNIIKRIFSKGINICPVHIGNEEWPILGAIIIQRKYRCSNHIRVRSLSLTYTDHIGKHREREGVEKKERSSETCKACCLKSTINLAVSYTYQVLLFDCASTPGLSSPLITRSGH